MPERLDPMAMAMRVAQEFQDGDVVNLGIGLPLLCSNFAPPDREVLFHSEQGIVGFGPLVSDPQLVDDTLINPGGLPVTPLPGMCFMSHDESFALVRGGHLDVTVLGALQVSACGDLANVQRPDRLVGNLGGAQDLATCARLVIVLMYHTTRHGEPKLVSECTLPLTAARCVDLVVTDLGVFEPAGDHLVAREYAPGWSLAEIQRITGAQLVPAADWTELRLDV